MYLGELLLTKLQLHPPPPPPLGAGRGGRDGLADEHRQLEGGTEGLGQAAQGLRAGKGI